MALLKRKKPAHRNWHIYDRYDTKEQMARKFKKLRKDGFDVQWNKDKWGRYVLKTRMKN